MSFSVFNRESPLARRIIVLTILFSAFISLITTGFQLYRVYIDDMSEVESAFKQIKSSYLGSIRNSLWSYDIEQLQEVMDGISHLQEVEYVEVYDDSNRVISAGNLGDGSHITSEEDILYEYNQKTMSVGKFKIYSGLSRIYKKLWIEGWYILLANMIKTFFVALFMLFLFYKYISRHLYDMSNFAKNITIDNLQEKMHLKRINNESDELDDVVNAINLMCSNLDKSLKKRKQIEIKLKINETNLLNAQSMAHLGSWEYDVHTRSLSWSDEVYNIFGVEKGKVVNYSSFLEYVHPDDRASVDSAYIKSLEDKKDGYVIEHRIIQASSGKIRYVIEKCSHIKDDMGNVISSLGMVHDITELKLSALKIQEQSVELQQILDSMLDAVITFDGSGAITSCNESAVEIFGRQRENILSLNIDELIPEKQVDLNIPDLIKSIGSDDVAGINNHDFIAMRQNNKEFPIQLSLAELPRLDNINRLFVVTCHDTEIELMQKKQLQRSQKMDALGKLTGGVAHDYNNMLGVILGYAELLKEALSDQPKLYEYVEQIDYAGKRGANLTKKLLTFSRHEPTALDKLDINELLTNQYDMLQKLLTVRIKLRFELEEGLWPVLLDNSELEDVVLNMCINSMHAMSNKASGSELVISTRNVHSNHLDDQIPGLKAGDYIELSIVDNGTGMEDILKERIFEPFFSTKGDKGTGLGLSQVYGFVKRSNGVIKVDSKIGEGTKFLLYFPRYSGLNLEQTAPLSEDDVDVKGNETILVVDDEPSLMMLTTERLKGQGYKVLCAENGKQALAVLELEHVDLILSDVIMPEMNGNELATIVQEKYPDIKIQMASGYTNDKLNNLSDESLRQNLLHKPYESNKLFHNLRVLLSQ
ncbi:MAG: hypothetical protein DIZ80_02005 [endosymbiont of Galathealinum brachiosum]|uniref:histidine kinase n=1 Tax=endosymbiont of Galathealinum brachiosum TaxID=2200906 RepID=A0A370DMW7_9GAMM|nr:MAG: hypothetical protein DIZ80_02005 [endosymbiont of Galathealinum brachiosum]